VETVSLPQVASVADATYSAHDICGRYVEINLLSPFWYAKPPPPDAVYQVRGGQGGGVVRGCSCPTGIAALFPIRNAISSCDSLTAIASVSSYSSLIFSYSNDHSRF
jgi:hypothetical protein